MCCFKNKMSEFEQILFHLFITTYEIKKRSKIHKAKHKKTM